MQEKLIFYSVVQAVERVFLTLTQCILIVIFQCICHQHPKELCATKNCPFFGPCLTTGFSPTSEDLGQRQNGLSLCYHFSFTQAEHQTTMIFVFTKICCQKHASSFPSNITNIVVFCVFCIIRKVYWPSSWMLEGCKHSSTIQEESTQSSHYYIPRHMVSFLVQRKGSARGQ